MIVPYLKSLMRRRCRVRLRKWVVPFVVIFFLIVWITRLNSFDIEDDDTDTNLGIWSYKAPLRSADDDGSSSSNVLHWLSGREIIGKQLLAHDTKKIAQIKAFLPVLYPSDWGQASEADEIVLQTRRLLHDLGYFSKLSCKELDAAHVFSSLSISDRKYVDVGLIKKREVVLKSQGRDLNIKVSCMQSVYDATKCATMGNYRLLQEILFYVALENPLIVRQLGFCLRGERIAESLRHKGIILAIEQGHPLILNDIKHYSWLLRLQVIYQISSIINYISHSPLGSLRIQMLKSEDFVVVGDQIKLSDLDDLVVGEHPCTSVAQCYHYLKDKEVPGIQCLKKTCVGLNEKLNLKMVADHMLLPLMVNVPPQSKKAIGIIIGQLQNLQISTEYLVDIFSNMLAKAGPLKFSLRWYLKGHGSVYRPKQQHRYRYDSDNYNNNNNNNNNNQYNSARRGNYVHQGDSYVGGSKQRQSQERDDDDGNDDDDDDNKNNNNNNDNDNREKYQPNSNNDLREQQQQQDIPRGVRRMKPAYSENDVGGGGGGGDGGGGDGGDGGRSNRRRYKKSSALVQGFDSQLDRGGGGGDAGDSARAVGGEEIMEWKDSDVRYFRYNSSNIPGIFDYTCPFSRATWGCVKTAYNITHAKRICTQDPVCKAFVLLSGQPDTETLLTVIFKNSSKSTIHRNTGATFFIKGSSLLGNRRKSNNNNHHQAPMTTVVHGFNVADCVSRSQTLHQVARNIREKRLRHHIGLRGITESQWLAMIRHATLDRAYDVSSSGQFLLNIHWTDLSEPITPEKGAHMGSVVFKGQQSSKSSYVGSMIVYKLDRLLGLYHTPPVSKMVLSTSSLQAITKNKQHLQQLQDLSGIDGSIEGFVQPPQLSSLSVQSITLEPLDQLTEQLHDISKGDKLFLEYILLVWLAKVKLNNNRYIGTKGHVILLNGDQAFTEFKADWLKYFNHCRFPNIVYKILACFRCNPPPSKIPSVPVCGLGEQVFTELQHDGVFVVDVYRKGREQIMNSAAADLLNVVDLCIQKHGRKHVLY